MAGGDGGRARCCWRRTFVHTGLVPIRCWARTEGGARCVQGGGCVGGNERGWPEPQPAARARPPGHSTTAAPSSATCVHAPGALLTCIMMAAASRVAVAKLRRILAAVPCITSPSFTDDARAGSTPPPGGATAQVGVAVCVWEFKNALKAGLAALASKRWRWPAGARGGVAMLMVRGQEAATAESRQVQAVRRAVRRRPRKGKQRGHGPGGAAPSRPNFPFFAPTAAAAAARGAWWWRKRTENART